MKLIRLTHYHDGSLVLVNVEEILMVHKDFSRPEQECEYTIVDCRDRCYMTVKESVEAVENLIHQATDSVVYYPVETKYNYVCRFSEEPCEYATEKGYCKMSVCKKELYKRQDFDEL